MNKKGHMLENLDTQSVVKILERWEMKEYVPAVIEHKVDGRKLTTVTEGIVKLWNPKSDAKKFIAFIQDLKTKPEKYLDNVNTQNENTKAVTSIKMEEKSYGTKFIEAQYQTVNVKRIREQNFVSTVCTGAAGVEDILKKIAPPKSFLYRNNQKSKTETPTSYVPMDAGTPKKPRKLLALSSYEFPQFDLKQIRFLNTESQISHNDRGYYSIKTNNVSKVSVKTESRSKTKSLSTPKELNEKFPDEHFYEDLCYTDIKVIDQKSTTDDCDQPNAKPYKLKIQELFQTIKLPFLRKNEAIEEKKDKEISKDCESDNHIDENSDVANNYTNIYDSVQVKQKADDSQDRECAISPEDYLEPVRLDTDKHYCDVACDVPEKDYCDVAVEKDDSLLRVIMTMIEKRFRTRRETTDVPHSEDSTDDNDLQKHNVQEITKIPAKSKENSKNPTETNKISMMDRPLPVPVENEPYYMDIERSEAENLLRGTPDGTFVLRPSSQPNHAYTLTVSCSDAVHNVGVRRRADGHLALGYARRGERSFPNVAALLRHHKKRRLLLVAGGNVCGVADQNTKEHEKDRFAEKSGTLQPTLPRINTEATDNQNTEEVTSTTDTEVTRSIVDTGNGSKDTDVKFEDKNFNSHHEKILRRIETIPDIKRDTSGITTQYIATGIVNLGAFAAGVCVAWSSSSLPIYSSSHFEIADSVRNITQHPRLSVTDAEASWAASLLCLGALFGAVPAGLISEYFGRKKTLLYLALPMVVSWILVAASPSVYGLYVGRFVGGVAVGAFSVSIPPYVEDIAEKQVLPTLANFFHLHFACGVLFGYIIGMIQNTSWFYFINASIPVGFFIAFIFLPESPAYLMSQAKFSEAKAALSYFRGIDNNVVAELQDLREHLRNSSKNKVTFKQLFSTKATVKALVVSFGLVVFQQLSGIYAVLCYAETIFATFPLSLNPPLAAIVLGFFLVTCTYFSSALLRNIRRRVLLLISLTSMAVTLGSLAVYYHLKASNMLADNNWVPLSTLCLYVSLYAVGIGPIPWLMLREIFPPNVRRRATAITAGFHWFLAFGVTKLYQNLVGKVGPGWTLWHFAVTCIIGTIFVYFFVPETKGRTLEDIQDEFDGIHRGKKHTHVIEVECYP